MNPAGMFVDLDEKLLIFWYSSMISALFTVDIDARLLCELLYEVSILRYH
jgi:hypothetical protein